MRIILTEKEVKTVDTVIARLKDLANMVVMSFGMTKFKNDDVTKKSNVFKKLTTTTYEVNESYLSDFLEMITDMITQAITVGLQFKPMVMGLYSMLSNYFVASGKSFMEFNRRYTIDGVNYRREVTDGDRRILVVDFDSSENKFHADMDLISINELIEIHHKLIEELNTQLTEYVLKGDEDYNKHESYCMKMKARMLRLSNLNEYLKRGDLETVHEYMDKLKADGVCFNNFLIAHAGK